MGACQFKSLHHLGEPLNWQAPRHPCGFVERAHEIGCLQVGCLQTCRHPESGACRPAGTLQAPGRHPAGTRDRVPGACRHRQAPGRHPAGTRNRGPAGLQAPCRHPAGIHQAPGVGCLVQGACRVPAGHVRPGESPRGLLCRGRRRKQEGAGARGAKKI